MVQHGFGLLLAPSAAWREIASLSPARLRALLLYPCVMALLPAVAWYYGTSQVGWSVGEHGETIKLTSQSALRLCLLFYLGMVACVAVIGYFIHWMSDTYGANSSRVKGVVIAGLAATPMFLAGVVGVYPVLWLDMLIGVAAVSWAVFLLYVGIPIVMDIPKERGFLFSSAVLAIALVILICLMGGSVILWEYGAAPQFTD
ncbi:MAG: Yip1 family protein [Halioglobus sp.]|nr:Yip1 family protein [Halioglobus sp.]